MTETDLVKKIRQLRQIQPGKNWVALTKKEILGEEPKRSLAPFWEVFPRFFFRYKPAFAGLIAVFILFGAFGYDLVRNSIPGDILYVIRKVAHEGQAIFVSESEKPAFQLKLANDRLEDLVKAPAKNLAPTISEFQANISEAVKNLAKLDATTSDPTAIRKIVEETKKIEENKQKVESLGVVVGETEELDNALGKIVGNLIGDLEKRTLSEEKEEILSQMKKLFEEEKYSEALELYLISQ